MLKIVGIVFASLLISSQVYAENLTINEKLTEMNDSSQSTFGVSLAALAFLFDIRENSYRPKFILEQEGQLKLIDELENAGYIWVDTQIGLPDGQEPGTEFVTFTLFDSGKEVQRFINR